MLRSLHLFAGAGGGILSDLILGHDPVCAVEWDPYCCQVLRERAAEGWFPNLQVWEGDVREFDGRPWAGKVDCVAGGFPCTDISIAGKGAGIEGAESGLWREMARIVGEVRPRFVFVENSPMLTSRGLGRILGDLAALGFDAEWDCFSAHEVGAPHLRERMFVLAYSRGIGSKWLQVQSRQKEPVVNASESLALSKWSFGFGALSDVPRANDGLAKKLDRIEAIGNGQCPQSAALAWRELYGRINS